MKEKTNKQTNRQQQQQKKTLNIKSEKNLTSNLDHASRWGTLVPAPPTVEHRWSIHKEAKMMAVRF